MLHPKPVELRTGTNCQVNTPTASMYPPGSNSVPMTLSKSPHRGEIHNRVTPIIQPPAIMTVAVITHKEKLSARAMTNHPPNPSTSTEQQGDGKRLVPARPAQLTPRRVLCVTTTTFRCLHTDPRTAFSQTDSVVSVPTTFGA